MRRSWYQTVLIWDFWGFCARSHLEKAERPHSFECGRCWFRTPDHLLVTVTLTVALDVIEPLVPVTVTV